MKIYVTQGHEKGIGIEVFIKSCLMLRTSELSNIELIASANSVKQTLETLKIPFKINTQTVEVAGINIPARWIEEVEFSESLSALTIGMRLAEKSGILFTLPTSKNQFPHHAGHTEYFRDFYKQENLGMFFSSPSLKTLLLTDHLAINQLSDALTEEFIFEKLRSNLQTLIKWNWPLGRILIAGLNPHAGENGMLGHEDERITKAIKRLQQTTKLAVSGPYPGDTMLLEKKSSQDLLVYMFHDQGLGVFKGQQGFIGSNITLGLPYPRFSPDHGTSFGLYGKNSADYRGCEFSLKEALSML